MVVLGGGGVSYERGTPYPNVGPFVGRERRETTGCEPFERERDNRLRALRARERELDLAPRPFHVRGLLPDCENPGMKLKPDLHLEIALDTGPAS